VFVFGHSYSLVLPVKLSCSSLSYLDYLIVSFFLLDYLIVLVHNLLSLWDKDGGGSLSYKVVVALKLTGWLLAY